MSASVMQGGHKKLIKFLLSTLICRPFERPVVDWRPALARGFCRCR